MKFKKIEVAPQMSVEQFEDIAVSFFPKILDMDYADVMITDESSLYDFDSEIDFKNKKVAHHTKKCLNRIKKIYGIDVSDVKDLLLVKIFERIRILRP